MIALRLVKIGEKPHDSSQVNEDWEKPHDSFQVSEDWRKTS